MRTDSQAAHHLAHVDLVMRRLIREVGPFALRPRWRRSPFESLARAIAYQQLHGKAAERILTRFIALFPGRRFPKPDELLAVRAQSMRAAGFSQPKILALRDLASKTLDGTVPSNRIITRWTDDAIIERLVEVRGIGRWTVQMLLIFHLGRPDILPIDDFGVRNGFRIAYRLATMPTPNQVLRYGERWKPYRTAASWYLWRAADRAKGNVTVL